MDDVKAKQQILEKIQASTNILVTVSNSPSVDALSAALGLTLLLDKLEKRPTAIFSGDAPAAIEFLEPEKTFDATTDSLRDFIIALDKEKADHIRLSKEGDTVRIFITPYKTVLSDSDLTFSQGDISVELVIALGVDNQDHLDAALASHGQILHDAAVVTVSAGEQTSTLGGIDWHDAQASSLSEMVVGLAEALKTDKTKSLLDGQIATAFLTGIVSATDRFSNPHTTARVMTTAAQLMAEGADQQLIATKLESPAEQPSTSKHDDKSEVSAPVDEIDEEAAKNSIEISHKEHETLEELDKRVKAKQHAEATEAATKALDAQVASTETPGTIPVLPEITDAYAPDPQDAAQEPTLGGTLNATSAQAADDARKEQEDDKNKTILSHSYIAQAPAYSAPDSPADGADANPVPAPDILGHDQPVGMGVTEAPSSPAPTMTAAYALDPVEPLAPSPAVTPHTELVINPPSPGDLGLPMPPALPDFNAPLPPITAQPERLGDILAPEPAVTAAEPAQPVATPQTPPAADNPAQFKIPGQ